MNKHTNPGRLAAAGVALTFALAGCGAGQPGAQDDGSTLDPNAKVELTMSGWNLEGTPEFKALADGFNKAHPNITVKLMSYSADDYDTQMTADLSAGKAPDIVSIRTMAKYSVYAQENQLQDLTDIATSMKGGDFNPDSYKLGDKYWAMPYRQDSYVMYYNKDMFKKTGVAEPTKDWTWNDFMAKAEELKTKLPQAGYDQNTVYPAYMHTSWQDVVQGFALGQTKGADFLSGDYNYLKPYYERALKMQDEKLTLDYGTVSSTKTQYQGQFGTQKAAMMTIGTWYIAQLVQQQKTGDADKFDWGIAPVPQNPDEPVPDTPKTFGSVAGVSIAHTVSGDKLKAAKEFIRWACGEDGAKELTKIGTTPAYVSDAVVKSFFSQDGIPQDELSRYAWQKHDMTLVNPAAPGTNEIQTLLQIAHSSIMTGGKSIDDAIATATEAIKSSGALDEK